MRIKTLLCNSIIIAGKNKDVARWLAECEAELEKSREKENKMYQAMFQAKI